MNNPWFRMYAGVINDPKVMKLPEATRWHWVACLCVASDNGGKLPPIADLAFSLRMTEQRAAVLVTELHRSGLLDKVEGDFVPHNWAKRQYKSDGSTERVKRFRERQRNGSAPVPATVPETGPEQNRTEQSRAEAPRAQIDLVEKVLRADLLEIFGNCDIDLSRASAWIEKGYAPSMICEVVREVRRRKPDVASLAYFDAAIAERHTKRPETPSERAAGAATIDFDKVVAMFVRSGVWSRYAGPEPGMIACRAPAAVLAKHGLAPDGRPLAKAS